VRKSYLARNVARLTSIKRYDTQHGYKLGFSRPDLG